MDRGCHRPHPDPQSYNVFVVLRTQGPTSNNRRQPDMPEDRAEEQKPRKQKRLKKSLQGITDSTPELSDASSEVRVINKHKKVWEDGDFQERTGTRIMLILYM